MKKDRRQFLKNTTLATLAIGVSPLASKASPSVDSGEDAMGGGCDVLTEDYFGAGPFYTPNAPVINDGVIAPVGEPGTRLIVTGIVKTLDCQQIIPNTVLDIWQANDAAEYDNNGFHLRGKVLSNSAGFYSFETIWPGKYLNGNQFRPRHIHLKITTTGFPEFTTQLYFEGDTSIPGDPAASIASGEFNATHRIIPVQNNGGVLEGTWDIVIDGDGTLGTSNLHLTNGMIYSVSPNPFFNELQINYGVFKPSNVKLEIYSMGGQLVASITEKELVAEKYTATWKPQIYLPSGIYFCVLKINGLQVHYKKIMKR
jgi:protocatechuate 3,4-dioxygenase beta subunit